MRYIVLLLATLAVHAIAHAQDSAPAPKRVAAIVTEYRTNSHADVIVSRLLKTESLDGKGRRPEIELVALYVDQFPDNDTSRELSEQYGVPIFPTIQGALTLGGDTLAVDGVLLIAEHGDYPRSETGNKQFPKRRFFDETVAVFTASDRVVPVYMDKHIADNWADIDAIMTTAREMKIPMIAGSVLPLAPRRPVLDVTRGAELEQVVVLSYHTLDAYGFHALEIAQSLAERRAGGETGIAAVRCLSDEATWSVLDDGSCDPALYQAALSLQTRRRKLDVSEREHARKPSVMIVEYVDGLTVYVFTLNGIVDQWTAAWKTADGNRSATAYVLQDGAPYIHFALLTRGIESLIQTGTPPWPVERTALVSGALDELLRSKLDGGTRRETPHLRLPYRSTYDWRQPAPAFLAAPRDK